VRRLFIAAVNGDLIAPDNSSQLEASFSDVLCRLASGGQNKNCCPHNHNPLTTYLGSEVTKKEYCNLPVNRFKQKSFG
jgi:hypothetical protein